MNDPRGSMWRKWDLHVHTPESFVHCYDGPDPWPQFLDELEQLPADFKVIGINDYIFLDGYKRILSEKAKGRLKNIELFLPVVELRLDKFGGSQNQLSRVNYHVIFSNEIEAEVIEHQFLNALSSKYALSPQYVDSRNQWKGLPTKQSLADLGQRIIDSVPASERENFAAPLTEGFNNLCLSLDSIQDALTSHYFTNKFLTAVGKTEWADIKWNNQSIADKKNIINGVNLVFTAADTVAHWTKAHSSLKAAGVNSHLLDCSDAHAFQKTDNKDRLGRCFTWIKADTTFEGLKQVLIEFDDRHYVGELPPQQARVRGNPTKYIKSIEIKRKSSATITEKWFDNVIPINSGLVAIIGNKGKGKSALTDIIGLICETRQHENFTFLSQDNFRQPRENKAKHFEAAITLESGIRISKGLDAGVDESRPELVKYIPQNFLEKICTQLGKIEETDFDHELKNVIFSHVEDADRLGHSSLDDLIAYKAQQAKEKSDLLKLELHQINEDVVALEARSEPSYRQEISNFLELKSAELRAHESAKPAIVEKPENDPSRQDKIVEISRQIEVAKGKLAVEEQNIRDATSRKAEVAQLISVADRLSARIDNLNRQIETFLRENGEDFGKLEVRLDQVLAVNIDKTLLQVRRQTLVDERDIINKNLDPEDHESLLWKKSEIESEIKKLEAELDEPNQRYQAYMAAVKAWEQQRDGIVGNALSSNTFAYYEAQLAALDGIPELLSDARRKRLDKVKEIHEIIRQLAETYRELYAPVNRFIETGSLAREKFHLNFEVGIVDTGFLEEFFGFISQGPAGTFCGVEAGTRALKEILARQAFDTDVGVIQFLNEIVDSLNHDQRQNGKSVKLTDQLRKGRTPLAFYDSVFSLDYIKPRYALRLGSKELSELSPGERGTLLLVFYLLVDKDDIPLVIDQPEENLDNQTVFELLVPCMKEAKTRRQVFMVTHNPNLAVVCDAEQIICADLDKANSYRMKYLSGAIENPEINDAIVNILEGTMPAFHNRQEKYFTPNS